MPLKFNGKTPDVITFNNKDVLHLIYNGVEVWTKNTSPQTWVLNDNLSETATSVCSFDCNFNSEGVVFNSLSVVKSGEQLNLKYDDITACNISTNTWSSNGYKTLAFSTAPTGELKQWLITNGTLSEFENPTKENFTLSVNSVYKATKNGNTLTLE